MNAEGQLDTDEDVEEEAEGVPEAVLGNNEGNGAEGGAIHEQVIEDVLNALSIDSGDEDDTQEEEVGANIEAQGEGRVRQRVPEIQGRDRVPMNPIPQGFVPPAFLLRRASTSSLDESSQKTSCKTSNELDSDLLQGPSGAEGSSGRGPSYHK